MRLRKQSANRAIGVTTYHGSAEVNHSRVMRDKSQRITNRGHAIFRKPCF